jgi:hypothetical protein
MKYNVNEAINILSRTPSVLDTLLRSLPDEWLRTNEGGETWSPFDVLGHLLHGEQTDWIARLEIILGNGSNRQFASFDRFAQFEESKGKSMDQLLDEFKSARQKNIQILQSKNIQAADMCLTGIHPVFGEVTLENLLSTWVVHDLDHISQIVRVMAHQYELEVGPWKQYLRILNVLNHG